MLTIHGRNVTEAWAVFHRHINQDHLVREVAPRGKRTREFIDPVATTYKYPRECVLFDPVRDCNPFFHLYEAFWILMGYNDVERVRYYSSQISVYSDDAKTFHGAYGHRLRRHFVQQHPTFVMPIDQLQEVCRLLRNDPDSRRGVLQLYDASTDTGKLGDGKDIPCNTVAYVKLREDHLNLTVCNRSNDAVWGCYGANAVQFSFLLQYLAGMLGVAVGTYTQVSDSLHVYLDGKEGDVWNRCAAAPPALSNDYTPHVTYLQLVQDPHAFNGYMHVMMEPPGGRIDWKRDYSREPFLAEVAVPMFKSYQLWKEFGRTAGYAELNKAWDVAAQKYGKPEAWLDAGVAWMQRRIAKDDNAGQR